MKINHITLIVLTSMILEACSFYNKNSKSAISSLPSDTTVSRSTSMPAKPANGIYEPGNEELFAIAIQHSDVTLSKLKQGYAIYSTGACINCHKAKNIYQYDDTRWKYIMDDMAPKARINDEEKDAVYKYVLSIKAAQPK